MARNSSRPDNKSGLRRRKTAKSGPVDISAKMSDQASKKKKRSPPNKVLAYFLLVCYLPILGIVNPLTAPRWMAYIFGETKCTGICSITEIVQEGGQDQTCGPFDSDRLVYVRIPKTASTTLMELFAFQKKPIALVDLGELEGFLVSSIPKVGATSKSLGYHDPTKELDRKRDYYKSAAHEILYPAQKRTLFQGHLHYFDFEKQIPRFYPNSTSLIPDWLLQLYNRQYPLAPLQIPQVTLLRNPTARLASMYVYDRFETRNHAWRTDFVQRYGNETLNDCLLDSNCVTRNRLQYWCNIQSLTLCGVDCKIDTSANRNETLHTAKMIIKDTMLWTGIMERLPESLQLLKQILPIYMETWPLPLPQSRQSSTFSREAKHVSTDAQQVLNNICQLDQELYDYANQLLTDRLKQCASS